MLKTFSMTDIGKKRQLNQDYVYTSEMPVGPLPNLFLVADGMGGHQAGDYASRYTVETVIESVSTSKETDPKLILQEAIREANRRVFEKSLEDAQLNGMGTTLVAATCNARNELVIANVGDSRLYLAGDELRQITRDHSLVEEMIRMGGLARNDARNHPDKNIITRAIGVRASVEMDFFIEHLKENETMLMCTDGLTNMLEDDEILMILHSRRDIVEKAEELIKAANNNGGKDNIAVVLVENSNQI